jgi:hypothetical protein
MRKAYGCVTPTIHPLSEAHCNLHHPVAMCEAEHTLFRALPPHQVKVGHDHEAPHEGPQVYRWRTNDLIPRSLEVASNYKRLFARRERMDVKTFESAIDSVRQ